MNIARARSHFSFGRIIAGWKSEKWETKIKRETEILAC